MIFEMMEFVKWEIRTVKWTAKFTMFYSWITKYCFPRGQKRKTLVLLW